MAKPEAAAREKIDQLLTAAGWAVCDGKDANITAHRGVVIREFQLKKGHGVADCIRNLESSLAINRPRSLIQIATAFRGESVDMRPPRVSARRPHESH